MFFLRFFLHDYQILRALVCNQKQRQRNEKVQMQCVYMKDRLGMSIEMFTTNYRHLTLD